MPSDHEKPASFELTSLWKKAETPKEKLFNIWFKAVTEDKKLTAEQKNIAASFLIHAFQLEPQDKDYSYKESTLLDQKLLDGIKEIINLATTAYKNAEKSPRLQTLFAETYLENIVNLIKERANTPSSRP